MPPRPPTRPHQKPGPIPGVLEGFQPARPRDPDNTDPWWNERSTPYRALQALRTGATWELAAAFVRVHPASLRNWNSRGQALLNDRTLTEYDLEDHPDDESFAHAAFTVAAAEARSAPAILALGTISRAANTDHDWRAAAHMLKTMPATKHVYAEVSKQEVSGPDGGPIQMADPERVAALLARAEAQRDPDPVED